MIEFVAHRGWDGRNTPEGIIAAISNKHGAEFDIRDNGDDIVIAHDPFPRRALPFEELLYRLQRTELLNRQVLAINIKSAGLGPRLSEIILDRGLTNYFCFDMASPDALEYAKLGLRFLNRASPAEGFTCDGASGTILDCMENGPDFYEDSLVERDRIRFVVCPTMHKQPEPKWEAFRNTPTHVLRRMYYVQG